MESIVGERGVYLDRTALSGDPAPAAAGGSGLQRGRLTQSGRPRVRSVPTGYSAWRRPWPPVRCITRLARTSTARPVLSRWAKPPWTM